MKIAIAILSAAILASTLHARTWTSSSGSTIEAEMVSKNSLGVNLRRPDGKEIFVKFDQLSQADREFVEGEGNEARNPGQPTARAGRWVTSRTTSSTERW